MSTERKMSQWQCDAVVINADHTHTHHTGINYAFSGLSSYNQLISGQYFAVMGSHHLQRGVSIDTNFTDNLPLLTAICKDTPNGAVPIEKSCVRYWLCVGGYPRLQRCPAGLALNTNTFKCELASTVPGW